MANPYVATNTQVSYGLETTDGTASGTLNPGTRSPILTKVLGITNQDAEFPDKTVDVKQYATYGTGRRYRRNMPGRRIRDGTLNITPTSGEFLYYVLGRDSLSGSTHTLTTGPLANGSLTRAILPSFSLAATMFDDAASRTFQRVFLGTAIDQATFKVEETGELAADLRLKSLDVEDHDTTTPAVPSISLPTTGLSSRPYMWYDSTVTVYGVEAARVQSMEASVNNKLNAKYYLTTGTGQDPFEYTTGLPEFSFRCDFVPAGFRNAHVDSSSRREAVYQLLEDETTGDVTVRLRRQAAPEDSITFTFTDCLFREAKHSWRRDGNESVVPVELTPRDVSVTVVDSAGQYGPG